MLWRIILKPVSAGLLSGAIVGLFLGIVGMGMFLILNWSDYWLEILHVSLLLGRPSDAYLGGSFALGYLFLISATICSILGGLAGLMFVKLINKIPISSTKLKSIFFGFCFWLSGTLLIWGSMTPFHFLLISLFGLGLTIFQALLFSYLFERWTRSVPFNNLA